MSNERSAPAFWWLERVIVCASCAEVANVHGWIRMQSGHWDALCANCVDVLVDFAHVALSAKYPEEFEK